MDPTTEVDHQRLESSLQALLGPHAVAACRSTADADLGLLAPGERVHVSGAIAQRQREFAAGRSAARVAMRRLGRAEVSVPANPDRSPCWPSDLVGSISHCRSTCVAVLALSAQWSAVGVDVEPDSELPRDLWPSICLPGELQRVCELPEAARARWVTRVFSAKETYYKWVYPRIRTLLDFHDVAIEMQPTLGDTRFVARPLRREALQATPAGLEGTLTATQGLVVGLMIH